MQRVIPSSEFAQPIWEDNFDGPGWLLVQSEFIFQMMVMQVGTGRGFGIQGSVVPLNVLVQFWEQRNELPSGGTAKPAGALGVRETHALGGHVKEGVRLRVGGAD